MSEAAFTEMESGLLAELKGERDGLTEAELSRRTGLGLPQVERLTLSLLNKQVVVIKGYGHARRIIRYDYAQKEMHVHPALKPLNPHQKAVSEAFTEDRQRLTREELVAVTGLLKGQVNNAVSNLLRRGLLVEEEHDSSNPDRRGRVLRLA